MTKLADIILRDTRANQPAFGTEGRVYYVTDEQVTERDSGSAWEDISDAGSGGGGGGGYTEGARVYASGDQTISNGSLTPLTYNAELYDTDGIHESVTHPTRLTCQTTGIYMIIGSVVWASNNSGARLMNLRLNGSTDISYNQGVTFTNSFGQVSTIYSLTSGDYVEFLVFQDSGGNLNALTSQQYAGFMMQRIG